MLRLSSVPFEPNPGVRALARRGPPSRTARAALRAWALRPLAWAAAWCTAAAWAQAPASDTADEDRLPVTIEARELRGRPDLETIAEGEVDLRRGPTAVRADRVEYDHVQGIARARGHVRVTRDGNVFTGPELQLQVERYEGFFLEPTYFFSATQAGGRAERIDFLGRDRLAATQATYSSCTPDDEGEYAWLLRASRVKLDFERNEGVAEGAVLTFYGVPLLAAPALSFPLTEERKTGWLPPNLHLDSKSGLELGVPYYWNIAPQRDMTLTPSVITKRGVALGTEFRYLHPQFRGEIYTHVLPGDRVAGRDRGLLHFQHEGRTAYEGAYRADLTRVSDDDYWKDLKRQIASLTPRLLPGRAEAHWWVNDWKVYGGVHRWQVLQDPLAPIDSPYAREPQLGTRRSFEWDGGWRLDMQAEVNRFVQHDHGPLQARPDATRVHALGRLAWAVVDGPGWFLRPQVAFNAASYRIDATATGAARDESRLIPTLSVDTGWVLERESTWFGRRYIQTLEPRVLYVNTPYRDQSRIPLFDTAVKDFNFTTLFAENPFSGVDRVADAHHVTLGAYTRFIDPGSGGEALRLGLAQRYLLREQRITPEGVPFNERFSDVLLLGSTSLIPDWGVSGAVQYNPDLQRTVRSTLGVRYSPGPYRTVGATYSMVRNASERIDVGWQWPVFRASERERGKGCRGSLYTVGRVNYSLRDQRVTDSLMGFEYDAGCWIGRFVVERESNGVSEATTRFMFQLEFVGLSRLGSNPLRALQDNIPGYQLLRGDAGQR